jgi:8-oxo-dGTP pyrophosphatase MutT (NUDIX family)
MKYGTLFYVLCNGQVLMINKFSKRENDPNSGLYAIPGGKLEYFEKGTNPKGRLECAVRETFDETGLLPINLKLRGVILFDNSERIFDDWKNPEGFLVHIFYSEEYSGKLKEKSDEGIPCWINECDIKGLSKSDGDKKMYEWIKDGRFFVGVIKHKGKSLDESGTFVDFFNQID